MRTRMMTTLAAACTFSVLLLQQGEASAYVLPAQAGSAYSASDDTCWTKGWAGMHQTCASAKELDLPCLNPGVSDGTNYYFEVRAYAMAGPSTGKVTCEAISMYWNNTVYARSGQVSSTGASYNDQVISLGTLGLSGYGSPYIYCTAQQGVTVYSYKWWPA